MPKIKLSSGGAPLSHELSKAYHIPPSAAASDQIRHFALESLHFPCFLGKCQRIFQRIWRPMSLSERQGKGNGRDARDF